MTGAELLELFNDMAGRAAADSVLPAKKYTFLSRAEKQVITEIARVRPSVLYQKVGTSSLPQLVTTDNNVFTFGTSGGKAIVPIGATQIYRALTDIPDRPLIPGYDYLDEGSQIRLPRNRTLAGPFYYRGIVMPPAISALEDPHLIPEDMNELTAIKATQNFATTGNLRNAALMNEMRNLWRERFPVWCITLKRQFSGGGALAAASLRDLLTSN